MIHDVLPEIYAALREIAPERDPPSIARDAVLQDALELDSLQYASFLEALSDRLGVDFPDADHPRLRTIGAIEAYIAARSRRVAAR